MCGRMADKEAAERIKIARRWISLGDSLTIESAIKHAEEVAEENREYAEDALDRYNLVPSEITKQEHDRCKQCAAEYSQLAEWLKDYKRLLEREPCEDAISRAEAIRIASGYCYYTNIPKELEKLPAVQPEPKKGEWITEDMFDGEVAYRCAVCGELFWIVSGTPEANEYNFCPKCGTMLVEPQESEENV